MLKVLGLLLLLLFCLFVFYSLIDNSELFTGASTLIPSKATSTFSSRGARRRGGGEGGERGGSCDINARDTLSWKRHSIGQLHCDTPAKLNSCQHRQVISTNTQQETRVFCLQRVFRGFRNE